MSEIINNRYMKLKRRNKDGSIYYQCHYKKKGFSSCPGTSTMLKNTVVREKDHNHPIDNLKDRIQIVRYEQNEAAVNKSIKPHVIIEETLVSQPPEVIAGLGSQNAQAQRLRRIQRKNKGDFAELDRPPYDFKGRTRETLDGREFLRYDETVNGKRLLIFFSDEDLQILEIANYILVDGTFKIVPKPFLQLVTVHAEIDDGYTRPCVYALLESKEQREYDRLFEKVQSFTNIAITPKYFLADFELALQNSLTSAFPFSDSHGCFFHYTQSITRYFEKIGLAQAIEPGRPLFTFWLRLRALPFIHISGVTFGYSLAKSEVLSLNIPDVQKFTDYYEKNYLYGRSGLSPRYPIPMWNCANLDDGIPNATNCLERWHRSGNESLYSVGGIDTAKLSLLVPLLQKQSAITSRKRQLVTTTPNVPMKQKPRDQQLKKNKKLRQIISSRGNPPQLPCLQELDEIGFVLRML